MQFPRTVDEITAEWLTETLRESGAIRDAAVESFEIMNVGDDQGVAGEVNRLKLSYDRPEINSPGAIIVMSGRLPSESLIPLVSKFSAFMKMRPRAA